MFGYSISDFIAYDKGIWLAMVSRYLVTWWWVGVLATAALLLCVSRWRTGWPALAVLSVVWAWVGWQFHWREHLSLNWAAGYWAIGFWVQAGLLAVVTVLARMPSAVTRPAVLRLHSQEDRPIVLMSLGGLLLLPALMGWLVDGTSLSGFEWFGLTPDATALMTLMLLVMWRTGCRSVRMVLALIPMLSLGLSAALNFSLGINATAALAALWLPIMAVIWLRGRTKPDQIVAAG